MEILDEARGAERRSESVGLPSATAESRSPTVSCGGYSNGARSRPLPHGFRSSFRDCAPLRTPSFPRRHRGSGRVGSAALRTPSSVRSWHAPSPSRPPVSPASVGHERDARLQVGMEAAKLAVAGLVRPENPEVDPGAIGHEQPTKGRLRARERDRCPLCRRVGTAMICRLAPGIHPPRRSRTPGPRGCEGVSRG